MKPKLPPLFKRRDTMSSRMDMAIYQAISQKPISYPSKIPDLIAEMTILHPVMPMERIMGLIEAGVDPSFRRRTGEDAMLAALINNRMDIVQVLHDQYGISISPTTINAWVQRCHRDSPDRSRMVEALRKENDMLKSEVLRLRRDNQETNDVVATPMMEDSETSEDMTY